MNLKSAREILAVIRSERTRRYRRLPDDGDAAYDQWLFSDGPFVNEMCLLLLVAIRHQVERELLKLAARATRHGREICGSTYRRRLRQTRRKGWKFVISQLNLTSFSEWAASMTTLQLLANCYKHSPTNRPESALIRHLRLRVSLSYAELSESEAFRAGMAWSLRLAPNTDFCDITAALISRVEIFLADVERGNTLSAVRFGLVSFTKFES